MFYVTEMMSDSQTSLELPVLDISEPLKPCFLSPIAEACKQWGFFLITNHGISIDLYTKLHCLCKELFDLPPDMKLKLGPFSPVKTYTPHFIASPFFESLRVSGPDFFASARSSADVLLDQRKQEFCEVLQEYGNKMAGLCKKVVELMLMILGDGFEKKHYESDFSKCHGYLRINNYCPPEKLDHEVEGLGMHTDMSCVTIVYQDDIGGLQVRSTDGKWLDIIPREGILVVNIGDLLQAWSNDRLRSSEHRVVLRRPMMNRFSMAFFWCFEDEKEVIAPDEVVGEGKLRLYNPFRCSDYVKFRESSEQGKFEKVGFNVRGFAGVDSIDLAEEKALSCNSNCSGGNMDANKENNI